MNPSRLIWLASVAAALSILKTGRDRALVLPAPLMLWLVFSADRAATLAAAC